MKFITLVVLSAQNHPQMIYLTLIYCTALEFLQSTYLLMKWLFNQNKSQHLLTTPITSPVGSFEFQKATLFHQTIINEKGTKFQRLSRKNLPNKVVISRFSNDFFGQ